MCPGAPLFAVGYENGSLELWDVHQLVCTQVVVGPCLELTSVAWAMDTAERTWRTFAAFLDGTVAEVLWRQASVEHFTDACGGVIWCLAAQPLSDIKPGFAHQVAAACDDGSVRLLGCEGGEPGLVLERVLARLEGRLLCCAWHAGGTSLAVSGTSGNIHLLDATTGRELLRITARASSNRPLTVWRLLSLPDGTLVSGDSDGATQMWDGSYGTLLHRSVQHRADVLALAAAEGGSCVFAAGVDAQVAMFQRVPGSHGRPDTWSYTHYKRPHTHDVRALASFTLGQDKGSVLISGGVDAQLLAYRARAFLQEHPTRLCKCPQRPICQAAASMPSRALVLVAQHDTLDVWQAAEAAATAAALPGGRQQPGASSSSRGPVEGQPLDMKAGPRHVARIQLKGTRIASAAIDVCGGYVACTTPAGTRVYRLSCTGSGDDAGSNSAAGSFSVQRLRLAEPSFEEGAVAVALASNGSGSDAGSSMLVAAYCDGSLAVCSLPDGELLQRRSASSAPNVAAAAATTTPGAESNRAWRSYVPAAARLAVAANGQMLAVQGGHGINLYKIPSLEPCGRTLKSDYVVTGMALSSDGSLVAAITSACQLLVWDTAEGKPLTWALDNADAARAALERLPGAPTGISFRPRPAGAASASATAPQPPTLATGAAMPEPQPSCQELVVHGSGGLVHFGLGSPVDRTYLDVAATKRQRGRLRPDQRPQLEDRPESRGMNGRVVRSLHPCLWLGHMGPSDMLLLEKPWEEVLAALPPPLLRHRYGN